MRRSDRRWALLLGFALIAPSPPARHAIPGRYVIPSAFSPALLRVVDNAVSNPGFETGNVNGGWYQCGDVDAYVTTAHPYRGSYDEYSGTRNGKGEPAGNSGVCQRVTIPPGGILTAYLYQLSDEPDATFAFQEGDLLDDRGDVVVNLYRSVNHTAAWIRGTWNLAAYAGRTYWLYFGVHGDGYQSLSTQQFVDEVSLAPHRE